LEYPRQELTTDFALNSAELGLFELATRLPVVGKQIAESSFTEKSFADQWPHFVAQIVMLKH